MPGAVVCELHKCRAAMLMENLSPLTKERNSFLINMPLTGENLSYRVVEGSRTYYDQTGTTPGNGFIEGNFALPVKQYFPADFTIRFLVFTDPM